jgi:hypothetical protein
VLPPRCGDDPQSGGWLDDVPASAPSRLAYRLGDRMSPRQVRGAEIDRREPEQGRNVQHDINQKRFGDLPPAVRERLATEVAAHIDGRPSAVVFSLPPHAGGGDDRRNRAALLGLLCLGLAGLHGWAGFGQSVQDAVASLGYIALLTAAIVYLLKAWPLHRRGLPSGPAGIHVFAWDIVDVGLDGTLTVHPLRNLRKLMTTELRGAGNTVFTRLDFTLENGRQVSLPIPGQDLAPRCVAAWQQRHQALNAALQTNNRAAVAALDPFDALRQQPGLRPPSPFAWDRLRRHAIVWALGTAIPVGAVAWAVRNLASDQVAFTKAVATGTEQAYLDYLGFGWRHVDAARAALPRAALADARRTGTVTALRAVPRRYPKAGLEPEVTQAVHDVFQKSFERFRALAKRSDATVEPFVGELLTRLESSGDSAVTVKFIRAPALGSDRRSLPANVARHFGEAGAASREQRMVSELAKGFRLVFPQDVFQLVRSDGGPTRPVLQVEYGIGPSGMTYRSDKTMQEFVGVVVRFNVHFVVPGSPTSWRGTLQVLPPDRFSTQAAFPTDEQVYGEMANRAFDQLSSKLNEAFLVPVKPAPRAPSGTQPAGPVAAR